MKRALGLISVLLLAGCGGTLLAGCGGTPQRPLPAGALGAAADQRATLDIAATEPDMNCKARAFGLDPRDATDIDQVTTVYAWAFCTDKHGLTSEMVPAAVDRSGTVRTPSDDDWSGEVVRIFPPDVRDRVYNQPDSIRQLAG